VEKRLGGKEEEEYGSELMWSISRHNQKWKREQKQASLMPNWEKNMTCPKNPSTIV
jgi:hypothetical protein